MPRGNPKNWTAAQKKAWSKKMQSAKRAKARSSGKTTKRRSAPRKSNPSKTVRKKNPAGMSWENVAKTGAGVLAGAYLGYAITGFVGSTLIDRMPVSLRGPGYAAGAISAIIGGHWAQKKAKDLPVTSFALATSVPMFLRALASFDILPLGIGGGVPAQNNMTGPLRTFPRRKVVGMRGMGVVGGPRPGVNLMNGMGVPGSHAGANRPMSGMGLQGTRPGMNGPMSLGVNPGHSMTPVL